MVPIMLTEIDVAFAGAVGGCIGAAAAVAAVLSTKSTTRAQMDHDTQLHRSARLFEQRSRIMKLSGAH